MKKFIIPAMFCLALTVGCAEKKTETEAHTHEDGTTHEAHTEANPETAPNQEEFDATGTDTTNAAPATEGEHTHADGEPHSH
ncbi:hypothetical protein I5M27_02525 [Adhaeribacter sp. BT258]|uniref:Uncharacterized protein n=1 Tax=Adhaeribacter terrigena TaxID=2793070 RepID=A0ABS1BY61_9BACT|nr:hypothetical protein [Adhaeribacter terrigena]MBK0401841.1 hypothetical protein [Adhaeribacter terrigena]